jgi:hypothetical protein
MVSLDLWVYSHSIFSNQLLEIHEILYEHHVSRGHPTFVLFSFLPSGGSEANTTSCRIMKSCTIIDI